MVIEVDSDKLNSVIEDICDNYCKWPDITADQDELDEKCADCPLNNREIEEWPLGFCPWQE